MVEAVNSSNVCFPVSFSITNFNLGREFAPCKAYSLSILAAQQLNWYSTPPLSLRFLADHTRASGSLAPSQTKR